MKAIVMAGGKGKRLYPHTTVFPKPLMPLRDVPIIDVVLKKLYSFGFKRVTLAVGYLADLVKTYVGNGKRYGLKIDYSIESRPLGTIGPLSLVKGLNETFFVMNGDLITDIDIIDMLKFHKKSKCIATLAVKKRKVTVDYGVVNFNPDSKLVSHREKPVLSYHVGAGMCFFEPKVLDFIPKKRRFDFPDLIKSFTSKGFDLNIYKFNNYWRDVGRWEDYLAAHREFPRLKARLLKRKVRKVSL
jgi:NDP-sugar pyrophosphorylase family protein